MVSADDMSEETTVAQDQDDVISDNLSNYKGLLNDELKFVVPGCPSEEQRRCLRFEHPKVDMVFNRRIHKHLVLHVDRLLAENFVYNRARDEPGPIVDVGGNSVRHALYKREVWSCQPNVLATDYLRKRSVSNNCSHLAEECDCTDFGVVMFVHSLYYLTPQSLCKTLYKCSSKTGYAVTHVFSNSGSFANEASYVNENGRITMHVKGNEFPYTHPDLSWLGQGEIRTNGTTIVWSTIAKTFHVNVLQLKVYLNLSPEISVVNDGYITVTVKAKQLRGIWPMTWSETYLETANVPENIYAELKTYAAGRPKDTSLYQVLCNKAATKLKEAGISGLSACRMQLVMVNSIIAMDDKLENDLLREQASHYNDRGMYQTDLSLSRQNDWQHIKLVAAGLATAAAYKFFGNSRFTFLPLACWAAFGSVKYAYETKLVGVSHPYVPGEMSYTTNTPPVIQSQTSQVSEMSVPSQNKIKIVETNAKEKEHQIIPVGLVLSNAEPVSHSANQRNELLSVTNRALQTTCFSKTQMDRFVDHVKNNRHRLFAGFEDVVADYTKWIERYPSALRDRYRKDRGLKTDKPGRRKPFIKIEKLNLNNNGSYTDKAPRLIQAAQDDYNSTIGPWVYAFSKCMAKSWNSSSQIFYASGSSGEEIGSWLSEEATFFLENDYSSFDATINVGLLELEIMVYEWHGCNKTTCDLMRKAFKKTGKTPLGVYYEVIGTRPSGDQNTSCGNSLLNALIMDYALYATGNLNYCQVVQGDDNVVHSKEKFKVTEIESIIKELGLKPKLVMKTNINFVEFCSCRFWPTCEGRVLGPKIGKFLTKIGWMIRPSSSAKRRMKEYRGTMIGHIETVGHVPLCKEVVRHTLNVIGTKNFIKDYKQRFVNQIEHDYCSDTWIMFQQVYGLTKTDHEEIVAKIINTPLTARIYDPRLEQVVKTDC